MVVRRGKNKTIVALGRTILTNAYHMLESKQPYHDLGEYYMDEARRRSKIDYHLKIVEQLRCEQANA